MLRCCGTCVDFLGIQWSSISQSRSLFWFKTVDHYISLHITTYYWGLLRSSLIIAQLTQSSQSLVGNGTLTRIYKTQDPQKCCPSCPQPVSPSITTTGESCTCKYRTSAVDALTKSLANEDRITARTADRVPDCFLDRRPLCISWQRLASYPTATLFPMKRWVWTCKTYETWLGLIQRPMWN